MALLVAAAMLAPALVAVSWDAPPAAAAFDGQFLWPMGGTVTSIYWECRSDCARYHRAIDIANGCDTPIHAARSGTATVHSDPDGYGNYVKVAHDLGYTTLYAHMDSVAVDDGQSVTTNTILGYEGSTGASTGCHVHFEVRQDDNGPDVELKQFLPGKIGDSITRGTRVPYVMKLLEAAVATEVLDGPHIHDVPGEGDRVIGTAQAGDAMVAFSSWEHGGDTYRSVSFNGRVGWVLEADTEEIGGTAQRIEVDTALNVRSGPGTEHTDIGDVFGGQEYLRLASGADGGGATWHKIPYDGTDGTGVGWVHGGYGVAVTYDAPDPPPPPPGGDDLTGYVIAVDAGHGGGDPGGSGFGDEEKAFTLDMARRLRDLLEMDGATVLMTRDCDCTVSLQERVDLANDHGADRFLSIHTNACGGCGGHGTETYYHDSLPATSPAADLAGEAQAEVVAHLGTRDRGVKQANFFVLRETAMPAILVEVAFLDEAGDHAILSDPDQRQEAARAMLHGLQAHLGVPVHDPDDPPPPPPEEDNEPPVITVTAPDLDTWHRGEVAAEADITDDSALAWARARLAGGDWRWDSVAPHQWTFDTTPLADGTHDLELQAKDDPGNQASKVMRLKVDNTPPNVEVTNPQDGQTVFWVVNVQAEAGDSPGSGVDKVAFYLDGELRHTDTEAPYEWSWNSFWEMGSHKITAKAHDVAGHTAEHSVSVFAL